MQAQVGIIRNQADMESALNTIRTLKERARGVSAPGGTAYNPGWHTALDLEHLLSMAETTTLAALEREESRGGHTRDDFPTASEEFGKVNVMAKYDESGEIVIQQQTLAEMPNDLKELFED